jgi:Ycf66 protein N-terminus
MLAYILAVLVGTGSVGLYIAAFFFPEIHRKHDFIWSGVGFFYALTLWIYARQSVGGIVVGQTASVALVGWFGWQTLKLRRQLVPANQQTPLPDTTKIKQQMGLKPTTPTPKTPPKSRTTNPTPLKSSPPAQTVVEVKPSVVEVKPSVVEIKPSAVEIKPSAVEVKPSAVEIKPSAVEVKPSAVEVKPSAVEVKPSAVEIKPSAVEIKPSAVEIKPSAVEVKPSAVEIKPSAVEVKPSAVEVKPSIVKQIVDTPPAPPVTIPAPVEEEEKASITLQLEPPATAAKPLGQPVRPPAPPQPPQQGLLEAGAIVEVASPLEDINKAIDLEPQSDEG